MGLPDDVVLVPVVRLDQAVHRLATFSDDSAGLVLLVNDVDPHWVRMSDLLDVDDPVLSLGPVNFEKHTNKLVVVCCPKRPERLVHACYGHNQGQLDLEIPGVVWQYRATFTAGDRVF